MIRAWGPQVEAMFSVFQNLPSPPRPRPDREDAPHLFVLIAVLAGLLSMFGAVGFIFLARGLL
jgi:hypothetical protein